MVKIWCVEVCIDGNHDNNVKSNLKPLCANCHRGLHCDYWQYCSEELLFD